ncbi:formylglycine-generating enzyme required for sulfatase activity [Paenibacillus rhizosphaerae]|uniref:Formylglycine-generating enzyme required for sulfatase activity n=1 Tax=Paenibacillus rhizosphaerae TaxID=297318 RepID=A0A839TT75_9BACL|nr:formylglycine-generating enzyme family protein [Paenibacillus rhizosphaerae]MBB3128598.1 formylglycine-generating enzyme required for sulfatase activity [Paenibacillus rhizosphaerae]
MEKYGSDNARFLNEIMDLMVPIEGGSIELRDYRNTDQWLSSDYTLSNPGSSKRAITWTETLEPYHVMKYPVTQQLYHFVMHEEEIDTIVSKLPVTEVSWIETIAFCNELSRKLGRTECYTVTNESENTIYNKTANGFRLLSDAEWQYACKAGTTGYRYAKIDQIAWYQENSNGSVHKVGQLLPNPWRLYDMIGNVWEWCWDLYDTKRYGNYRVFRGGSWAEVENNCGSTSRRKSMPNFKIDDLGFRIALTNL